MAITADYIRGLIDGEGCFTFCRAPENKKGIKYKIPTFLIQMHERDRNLLEEVKRYFGVRDRVYLLNAYLKDGVNRGKTVRLMVRDFGELRDVIIPFFDKKLIGHKGKQFKAWIEKIGSDPEVHPDYKILSKLHKIGYFDKFKEF